ncbi:hypothetical protein TWF281_008661 [Arthrobotrys megalospora]
MVRAKISPRSTGSSFAHWGAIILLVIQLAFARHIEVLVGKLITNPITGRQKIRRGGDEGPEYEDTSPEWTEGRCLNLDWLGEDDIFQEIKFDAYEVNPQWPFFLKRILVYKGLDCQPQNAVPEATINIENIELIKGSERWKGKKKWQEPLWFCLPDTTYVHRPENYFSIGTNVKIENMEALDGLREARAKELQMNRVAPNDYNTYGEWEDAIQHQHNDASKLKADMWLEETLNRGRPHIWDPDASEHDTLEEDACELTDFFDVVRYNITGPSSLRLESDFTTWHVGQIRDVWTERHLGYRAQQEQDSDSMESVDSLEKRRR